MLYIFSLLLIVYFDLLLFELLIIMIFYITWDSAKIVTLHIYWNLQITFRFDFLLFQLWIIMILSCHMRLWWTNIINLFSVANIFILLLFQLWIIMILPYHIMKTAKIATLHVYWNLHITFTLLAMTILYYR